MKESHGIMTPDSKNPHNTNNTKDTLATDAESTRPITVKRQLTTPSEKLHQLHQVQFIAPAEGTPAALALAGRSFLTIFRFLFFFPQLIIFLCILF